MKIMFVAAMSGLLCAGATGEGIAHPGATAPSGPSANPTGANAGAVPLTRGEYLPKLQEFYARGKALYDGSTSDELTGKEVDLHFKEFLDWANEAGKWMNDNISPAATAKFTTWHMAVDDAHKLSGRYSEDENNKLRTLTTVFPQLLNNLQVMMAPDAADPSK